MEQGIHCNVRVGYDPAECYLGDGYALIDEGFSINVGYRTKKEMVKYNYGLEQSFDESVVIMFVVTISEPYHLPIRFFIGKDSEEFKIASSYWLYPTPILQNELAGMCYLEMAKSELLTTYLRRHKEIWQHQAKEELRHGLRLLIGIKDE